MYKYFLILSIITNYVFSKNKCGFISIFKNMNSISLLKNVFQVSFLNGLSNNDNYREDEPIQNNIREEKNLNVYYDMYNMALRNIGFKYISKYDIITTFCKDLIYTKLYLMQIQKNSIFALLNPDIISYISEFIPYFYSKYDFFKKNTMIIKYDKICTQVLSIHHRK
jgi:hypothetical protein